MTSAPKQLGRYVLHKEVARGGIAAVHIGRQLGDVGFSRVVAIKRLHAHLVDEPDFITMLIDEARLASKIHHPNVVSPTDVVAQDGEVFIVMNFVLGCTLANLVRAAATSGEPASLPIALRIVLDVLEGLHAAHEAVDENGRKLGIIHRDVSPQNILVGQDGSARLIDFGIAKATVRWQTTQTGQVKGKLPYMAPEQLRDDELDRRTDVYSAAVVLWELAARCRLFEASNDAALFGKVLEGVVQPPSRYNSAVPAALDAVVLGALNRDREQRPASARQFGVALRGVLDAATQDEVAAWVARSVQADLEAQRDYISEITAGAHATVEVPLAEPVTPSPFQQQRALPKAALLAGVLLGGGALALALGLWGRSPGKPTAASSEIASAPPPVSPTTSPSLAITAAPTPPSLATREPPTAATATTTTKPASPGAKRTKLTSKPQPPRASATVDCSKLYVTGPDGIRRVKKECL